MNTKQILSGLSLAVVLGISGPALADRIDNPETFGVQYTADAIQSVQADVTVHPEALDPAIFSVETSEEAAEAYILRDLSDRV